MLSKNLLQRFLWWGIEVFHRTLKSGCRIEDRRLGNAESLQACLAIDLVVAWRVMDLTKRGRETSRWAIGTTQIASTKALKLSYSAWLAPLPRGTFGLTKGQNAV